VFDTVDALTVLGCFVVLLVLGGAVTGYFWSPRCPKCGRRNGIEYCGHQWER
jgi:hypothetical protein